MSAVRSRVDQPAVTHPVVWDVPTEPLTIITPAMAPGLAG
ncbi:hypothetical protein RKD05_000597 [Microbacterium sp. SLBN-111]